MNLFVVYLDEAASNEVSLGCLALSKSNDLAEGSGDNTLALLALAAPHHRVSLAAPSLSVGEDRPVVPVENAVHKGECCLLIDQSLGAIWSEYIVVREAFGGFLGIFFQEMNLFIVGVDLYNTDAG